jgi:hypothetical protein
MTDCGCGDVQEAVDENAPDYPTNTETAQDNFGYAGGLNKPKASGMATVPVTDVSIDGEDMFGKQANEDDLRRMMEMAGIKMDEVYVVNPRSPSMSPDEEERADKAWNDEVALYKADDPAKDPDHKLQLKGFNRAQDVGARLASRLQKLRKYPELREPGLGVGESLEESEECSTCHRDPCKCESVEESIRRMKEIAGIKEAAKPDYIDLDDDGNKKESMKKAADDKKEKQVEESIFALTNQWQAYRG